MVQPPVLVWKTTECSGIWSAETTPTFAFGHSQRVDLRIACAVQRVNAGRVGVRIQ